MATELPGILFVVIRIGLTTLLYGFIFLSVYWVYREFQQINNVQASHPSPNVELSFPNQPKYPKFLRFSVEQILIGRDPICECHLPEETVSSKHTRLIFRQNQWWVEDLNSSNGTYLNEQLVETPIVLTEGDQIECGQVLIQISFK
ncbi:MAG: FHA domain-containing protein [Chloroflexota bacterium]